MPRLQTFREALARTTRRPRIRATQGGSSKEFAGAKVAATYDPRTPRRTHEQKAEDDAKAAAEAQAEAIRRSITGTET